MKKLLSLAALAITLTGCGVELGFPNGQGGSGSTGGQTGTGLYIFVTSGTFDGSEVNGISGADSICANDPNRPVTGTFTALLLATGRTTSNGWPLKANQQYIRPDKTIIGTTNALRRFDFNLSSTIGAAATNVWTGIGTGYSLASNCQDWSDNGTGGGQGQFGQATNKSEGAFASGTSACGTKLPIYCVQQ